MNKKRARKSLSLVLALAMILSVFAFTPVTASAASYGDLQTVTPEIAVTGSAIISDGYTKDNISLEKSYTRDELKAIAAADQSGKDLYTFSSLNTYDTKSFMSAEGIRLDTLLAKSGLTDTSSTIVSAIANDGFKAVFDPAFTEIGDVSKKGTSKAVNATRYYYPNYLDDSEDGKEEVPVIISWANKKGNDAPPTDVTVRDSGDLVVQAGQLALNDYNSPLFNRYLVDIQAGDEITETALTVGKDTYTRADVLMMERADRSYTYETSGGDQTDYARGVPVGSLFKGASSSDVVSFEAADGWEVSASGMTYGDLVAKNAILAYEVGTSAEDLTGVFATAKKDPSIKGYFTLYVDGEKAAKLINKVSIQTGGPDFENSSYKHTTYDGAPYNVDAITAATMTVEGPGVKTSTPLSVRELENNNSVLARADYTDSRGTYTYEGVDIYKLLTQWSGIDLTTKSHKIIVKDMNRRDIMELSIEQLKTMSESGKPALIAYGVGSGSTIAPFVYTGVGGATNPGYVDALKNDDGCLRLVLDTSSIDGSSYTTFGNMMYIYVAEQAEPGYKHDSGDYKNADYSNYVVSFSGAELGREIDMTLEQIESLVSYDENGDIVDGSMGHRDEYSLANTSYWYVNEYEGIKLWDLIKYLGIPNDYGTSAKKTTPIYTHATDEYAQVEQFTIEDLANADRYGFYEKNAADDGSGKYEPQPEDLKGVGYPVMLAYGVNRYPYVTGTTSPGYLSGLQNDGGPLRVIFGKKTYHHANGSNQVKLLDAISVGDNSINYSTHFDNPNADGAYKALANNEIQFSVKDGNGNSLKEKTYSIADLEKLIYGDVSKNQKKAALEKDFYELFKNNAYYSDLYEGVNLQYIIEKILEVPGTQGNVTFTAADGSSITASIKELFAAGYNPSTGKSGLASILAFAKNGSPMVATSADAGYEKNYTVDGGISYNIKNDGGPLCVFIPSTDAAASDAQSLKNVVKVEVDLQADKYAHTSAPYDAYKNNTLTVKAGGGTTLTADKSFTVADLEGKQTMILTADYNLLNKKGTNTQIRYRGLSLYDFLKSTDVGLRSNAQSVILTASDGFKVTLSMDDVIKSDYINGVTGAAGLKTIIAYGSSSVANEDPADGKPLVPSADSEGYDSVYMNKSGPLYIVVGQKDKDDINQSYCLSDVVSIEVTASELDSWKHDVSAIYKEFLSTKFTLTVKNDDHQLVKEYTLADLEAMDDVIVRDDYSVLSLGECEGLDLWKFVLAKVGSVAGVENPVAVQAYSGPTFNKDLLSIFGLDALQNGILDGNNVRKPILLQYAQRGYPLVDTTNHAGYVGAAGNADGPIRLVTETNQGSCVKLLDSLVVTIKGSGEIPDPDGPKPDPTDPFDVDPADGKDGDLPVASVRTTVFDSNGGMWVGTYGGGAFYKPKGSSKYTINTVSTNGYKLKSNVVTGIAPDSHGGVWFTQSKSYTDPTGNAGVAYRDANGKITYYDTSVAGTIPNNYVQEVKIDEYGRVWFGSFGGLTCFDPEKGTCKTLTTANGLPAMSVDVIECDGNGGVWVGCYPDYKDMTTGPFTGGYAHINAAGKVDFKYDCCSDENDGNTSLLADVWVRDIAVDDQGGAWIVRSGSYTNLENVGGRIDYVTPERKVLHYTGQQLLPGLLTNNSEVRQLELDADGGLWYGTWTGLFYQKTPGGDTKTYNSANGAWGVNYDNIYSLAFEGKTIYAGSNGGVAKEWFRIIKEGWYQLSGSWFYFRNNYAVTGPQKLLGYGGVNDYFFRPNGAMYIGFIPISGAGNRWMYMSDVGKDPRSSFLGAKVKNQRMSIASGYRSAREKSENKVYEYCFAANGLMYKGWVKNALTGNNWMYFGEDGRSPKISRLGRQFRYGRLQAVGNLGQKNYYYFSNTGVMKTGNIKVAGKTYYFNEKGRNPAIDALGSML